MTLQPEITVASLISIVGAIQGMFLGLVLFRIRANKMANRLLGLFLILFSLIVFRDVLFDTHYVFHFPHLGLYLSAFVFALAPVFFLYVKAMTQPDFELRISYAWHFMPMGGMILLLFPLLLKTYEEKLAIITNEILTQETQSPNAIEYLLFLQIGVYVILSLKTISLYAKRIQNEYSSFERKSLKWLRNMTLFILFIWLEWGMWLITGWGFLYHLENIIFSGAVYIIGYFSLNQPELFTDKWKNIPFKLNGNSRALNDEDKFEDQIESKRIERKYENSPLTESISATYKALIQKAMTEEKVFLNPELTLHDLSKSLSISPHLLSQVINEQMGLNFFDLINSFRVEEVKQKLSSPKYSNRTILAIALDSGFNSKTAFNSAFKKHTGKTPTAFRKANQQHDSHSLNIVTNL